MLLMSFNIFKTLKYLTVMGVLGVIDKGEEMAEELTPTNLIPLQLSLHKNTEALGKLCLGLQIFFGRSRYFHLLEKLLDPDFSGALELEKTSKNNKSSKAKSPKNRRVGPQGN